MRLRIGVISSQVFPVPLSRYGGLEEIAYQCAKGLGKLGHRVVLFAPDGSKGDGFDVHHTGPGGNWGEKQAFDHYWKSLMPCDVIIDHSWQKWSYTIKAEGALRCPVLGVWHAPVDTMKTLPPGVERPCPVLISEDQRAHFEGLFGRPGRTCYNGVDLDFYKPLESERNRRALFLARFSAIKGADLAIEACRAVKAGLDLVGDVTITNEAEYYRKVKGMTDGESIRVVGPESRGGCVHRFSLAEWFVHPNQRFREPFGLAPVEAMACGLPVVAWDHGAMRETVKHGETGLLVKDYAGLVSACGAMAAMPIEDKVRTRCREWASEFSVQRMAKRYSDLCEEAIQGGW